MIQSVSGMMGGLSAMSMRPPRPPEPQEAFASADVDGSESLGLEELQDPRGRHERPLRAAPCPTRSRCWPTSTATASAP